MSEASTPRRREVWYLIELLGITAVTVAQPVFDVIGQAPEELVNRRAGAGPIVAFALLVTVGPALVLWLVEQPFRLLGGRARDLVHAGLLGLGVGLFAVEVAKSALGASPQPWLWVLGPAVAAGAAVLFARTDKARAVPRYLALAAPAFLALFLLASPVADLVVGDSVEAADVQVADPAPVVLIILDELPTASLLDGEGHIDEETFPGFAALADDATFYRNTTGVSPVTPSALPAILTGRLPEEIFPAPVATRFTESLYTLLGDDYEVDDVETLTRLCSPRICARDESPSSPAVVRALLSLGRTVFESVARPDTDATNFEFVIDRNPADPLAPDRFRRFTTRAAEGEGLTLDVGHFLLPHQPWDFLASGRTYEAPDPPRSVEFGDWFDDETAAAGRQRHLAQLRHTDTLLRRALARLQAGGRYEESLVIVTADHGAAFVGGESLRGLTEENYHEVMWAPLFVKLPGQTEGAVDDRATETIDVLPTIADVLGVEIPWEVDGVPVSEPQPDDRPARMLDWRFNDVPAGEDGYAVLDREAGFERLLASTSPLAVPGDDPFDLLRLGEFGDLVGRDVDDLAVGDPAPFELVTTSTAQVTVPPGATSVPAYLEGIWDGRAGGWMAVAVDGTVAGIGRALPQGESSTFWALLAEHLFTEGDHEVTVYDVGGTPRRPILHEVTLTAP